MSRQANESAKNCGGILKIVTDIISKWPDFGVVAEKLQRLQGEIAERAHQAYDLNPDHFNTLNHDALCWSNLMVRTDNGTEENPFDNAVFIDPQYSYWGSATTDLHYFFNTTIDEVHRPHQFEKLVQFYHEHLTAFLKRLNYTKRIPTWSEFQKQYHDRRILGKI